MMRTLLMCARESTMPRAVARMPAQALACTAALSNQHRVQHAIAAQRHRPPRDRRLAPREAASGTDRTGWSTAERGHRRHGEIARPRPGSAAGDAVRTAEQYHSRRPRSRSHDAPGVRTKLATAVVRDERPAAQTPVLRAAYRCVGEHPADSGDVWARCMGRGHRPTTRARTNALIETRMYTCARKGSPHISPHT